MKKFITVLTSSPLARGVSRRSLGEGGRGVAKSPSALQKGWHAKRDGVVLVIGFTCAIFAFVAWAEDTGITTSQAYVETKAAEKQDAAPANNANSVMTYDSTSADGVGKKAIYDSSASYPDQTDALMTADTANAAIQNAINNEFTCANPPKCTLWNMFVGGETSKNLFRGAYRGGMNTNNSVSSGKNLVGVTSPFTPSTVFEGPIFVATVSPGQIYHVSFESDTYYNACTVYAVEQDIRDTTKAISTGRCKDRTITAPDGAHVLVLSLTNNNTNPITWSNVQLEPGTTATQYQPYGANTFVPQNQ